MKINVLKSVNNMYGIKYLVMKMVVQNWQNVVQLIQLQKTYQRKLHLNNVLKTVQMFNNINKVKHQLINVFLAVNQKIIFGIMMLIIFAQFKWNVHQKVNNIKILLKLNKINSV